MLAEPLNLFQWMDDASGDPGLDPLAAVAGLPPEILAGARELRQRHAAALGHLRVGDLSRPDLYRALSRDLGRWMTSLARRPLRERRIAMADVAERVPAMFPELQVWRVEVATRERQRFIGRTRGLESSPTSELPRLDDRPRRARRRRVALRQRHAALENEN